MYNRLPDLTGVYASFWQPVMFSYVYLLIVVFMYCVCISNSICHSVRLSH